MTTSRSYAEFFVPEGEVVLAARARAADLGCVPIGSGGAAALDLPGRHHRRPFGGRDRHRCRGQRAAPDGRHGARRDPDLDRRRGRASPGGQEGVHRCRYRADQDPVDQRPCPRCAAAADRRRLRPGLRRRRQEPSTRSTSRRRCACCAPAGCWSSTVRWPGTRSPIRPSATARPSPSARPAGWFVTTRRCPQ